jgi:hypothetical protein
MGLNESGPQEKGLSIYAGQVPMDRRPGRIEFMSTQRRVCRLQRMSRTNRGGERGALNGMILSEGGMQERSGPVPFERIGHAFASGSTAPPERLATHPAWLATNSLRKDSISVRLVRHGYSPQASTAYRSSLSPISILPGSARFHLTLPQDPAGKCCWAERYDGKRDLHFKHAA